ncbi:MAG: alpha/beta hydrolase family protein [Sulfobacillus sp.]
MEDLVITTMDGAVIETYYSAQGKTAVILCHGKAFDRDSFVEYGDALAGQGYTVAIPNFRGYGKSTIGSLGSDAIEWDVLAVAGELTQRGHDVVPLGASRGGGGVLRAVARDPQQFKAVMTWSTVMVDAGVAASLGEIPKLFVVSAQEMMRDQTLSVFEWAPEPKVLREIAGSRHAQNIWNGPDRQLLENVVGEFLAVVSTD